MVPEEARVVLIITKLNDFRQWVDRKTAYAQWVDRKTAYADFSKVLRDVCSRGEQEWEGQLKAVIPMRPSVDGFLFKLVFCAVPDELLERTIIPGLEIQGHPIKKMAADAEAQGRTNASKVLGNKRKRMEDATDFGNPKSTVDKLIQMRGDGGPENKTRRFANGHQSLLSTSMRLLSTMVPELQKQDQNE